MSIAITGLPIHPSTFLTILSSAIKNPAIVEIEIRITGNNDEKKLIQKPGISSSVSVLVLTNSSRGFAGILLRAFDRKGPDITIAGIATIIPYTRVFPISA